MSKAIKAPSAVLLSLEPSRGLAEWGLGWLAQSALLRLCPAGDGRPIIVFPGLGTNDWATSLLRRFLSQLGYTVYPWSRGFNLGPRQGLDAMLENLQADLNTVHARHRQGVTLVGWSLGGIYARELAKLEPQRVQHVVTLGSPFAGSANATNGKALFKLLSGSDCHEDIRLQQRIAEPPPVPTTSLYSHTDGVVAWQCSTDRDTPHVRNVRVPLTSHLGLVLSPVALFTLARHLQHPATRGPRRRRPPQAKTT